MLRHGPLRSITHCDLRVYFSKMRWVRSGDKAQQVADNQKKCVWNKGVKERRECGRGIPSGCEEGAEDEMLHA